MVVLSRPMYNITIELMFVGVNMFLARLRLIFSITIIIISEGINKRNQRQYSKRSRYCFCERCRNRVGVYFIVLKLSLSQKLKTLAEHRKICQKNLCF